MKSFAVAAFVALASVAAAQDLIAIVGRLPACSQSCLVDPLGKDGCGPTDFKCHCGKADQLFNDVIPCVQQVYSVLRQMYLYVLIVSSLAAPMTKRRPSISFKTCASRLVCQLLYPPISLARRPQLQLVQVARATPNHPPRNPPVLTPFPPLLIGMLIIYRRRCSSHPGRRHSRRRRPCLPRIVIE